MGELDERLMHKFELVMRELAQSESRNRVLFEESPLLLIVYDPANWRILEVNASCRRSLGYPAPHWREQTLGFAVESGQREALYSLARKLSRESSPSVPTGMIRF